MRPAARVFNLKTVECKVSDRTNAYERVAQIILTLTTRLCNHVKKCKERTQKKAKNYLLKFFIIDVQKQ